MAVLNNESLLYCITVNTNMLEKKSKV